MKKIVSLFVLVAAFASCGEEIKFSNPAFQATKNGNIWKANDMDAMADEGGLTIIAAVGSELVTLHTTSGNRGTYTLSGSSANSATFMSAEGGGVSYESVSGEIKITEAFSTGTVTGTFKFVAEDEEGNQVTFTDGNFYKVP
nr:DUF6252 family protein [uncultured Flavobacterium sp.]